MNQSFADPRFRQKASEDMRDAIAGLTAANTLKVVLNQSTKAKQIAMLRHYVRKFDRNMKRCAKLRSSLADDDPQKKQVDDEGFTASFVVTTLNGILSDVMPTSEPPPWIKKMREGAKERALEKPREPRVSLPYEPVESVRAAVVDELHRFPWVLILWPVRILLNILLGLLKWAWFIFVLVLIYGVIVIIFKYAFGVQLWNPFG